MGSIPTASTNFVMTASKKKKAYLKAYYQANKEKKLAKQKVYREAHKEETSVRNKTYRETHKEEISVRNKAYNEAHKEEIKAYCEVWYKANKEKINAQCKAYNETHKEERKAYREANRDKANARSVKRRALKTRSILPTTDDELIKNLYKQRAVMTEEHGEPHHVDHIIPLSIGGAHHQDNLRIITAKENMEKNDKYIPELGGVWADNKLARKNRKKYEAL